MCPDVQLQLVRYEPYDSESVFSALQWKPWNADKSPEKMNTGRIMHHSPPSFQSVTSFLRLRPWWFRPSCICHVSVMQMMGTRPVCEGTVSESHIVSANPQAELAVGLRQAFHSSFEQYISCQVWLCWMKGSLSVCSRVHPQVTVHPNGLIISRCWQPAMCDPLNRSWAHSFLDSTYLYETATWLSVTAGPLILKTERHRSVHRLRGCWEATLRPPTGQNRPSDSISGGSRWTPNATQNKKSERKDGSLDTHRLNQGSSRTIKTAFGKKYVAQWRWTSERDSFSDLCLPPICLVFPTHSSVNNILVALRLFLLSNNNMSPGQSMWKCGTSVHTAIQEECLNPLESGEARPVVLETFLKLFLKDSHCFASCVTCGPNAGRWLCKFSRF